jgi:hypothetical protein
LKTLRFSILVEAIDSYIYSGHLFLILKDGRIAFTPLSWVIGKLVRVYPEYGNLIRLAFQRNDYLSNNQGKMILGIEEVKAVFVEVWEEAAENIDFVIDFDDEDYKIIETVPTMPVLDLKMYAMRLYIGCKEGLYEIDLNSDDRYNLRPSKPRRRFDAKVTCINAKSGEIIISSNSSGLFHGSFLNADNILRVDEKSVAPKSIRTGWSGYDIINYAEQSNFDYFVSKTEKADKKPAFSRFDENVERQRISEFAIAKHPMTDLLDRSKIKQNDIAYCFNSSERGFFFLKDGRFVNINLDKNKDGVAFTSRTHELPMLEQGYGALRPISTSIVPKGCVVEYMDKVVLYHNGIAQIIEKTPSITVRSYMGSIRYRNLISCAKEKEVSLHSIFPFDELFLRAPGRSSITLNDFEDIP